MVSTAASDAELVGLREELGRDPVVLTAPSGEAKRVVTALVAASGTAPHVELALAPVRFPPADRGHRLDALVRGHALRDRFRDVVVVADPATTTLLLRALAPDQLASGGAVTVVGLPRGDRPVPVGRAVASGVVLGALGYVLEPMSSILVLPAVVALAGLGVLLVPSWRHVGRALLLAAAVALLVVLAVAAGSARFPDGW